jgi:hypothetical protein
VAVTVPDDGGSTFRSATEIGLTKIFSDVSLAKDEFNLSAFSDGSKPMLATIFRSLAGGASFVGAPKLILSEKRPPMQIRQPSPSHTVLNITLRHIQIT